MMTACCGTELLQALELSLSLSKIRQARVSIEGTDSAI